MEVNGKWYDLDWFDDFEEIQEYLGLADEEQVVMMAYYEATNTFDWSEAQEAYVGEYLNDAEFAEAFCEEVEADTLGGLPDYLKFHIDWQGVSDSRMADNDNWHSDWGMEISIPDGVDYTADDVGKAMLTIMHRLTLARIEHA